MRDNFESPWSRFAAKLQKLELKPKEGLHLNGDLSQRKFSFFLNSRNSNRSTNPHSVVYKLAQDPMLRESFCVKVTAIGTCRTAVGHLLRGVGVAYKKGREI